MNLRVSRQTALLIVLFLAWAAKAMDAGRDKTQDPPTAQQSADKEKETRELVELVCANCHDLSIVSGRMATRDEWKVIVESMVARGADLSEDEIVVVTDYLSRHYPAKR